MLNWERTVLNFEDEMVQVNLPNNTTITYTYDHEGKRIGKTANGTTIDYYFDGDDLIIEAQGTNILAYYTQGQGLISQRRGSNSYFYHYDGLGSTKALTDANQNVQASYKYDAWGNVLQANGTIVNPYLYVGEFGYYFDDSLSLMVVGDRFLNTSYGVFLTRDSARLSILKASLYQYTNGSPINYIDPTGRAFCWIGYVYLKKYYLWYNRKTGKLDKITNGQVRHHKDWCAESSCIPKFFLFSLTYEGTARYEDGVWFIPTLTLPSPPFPAPSIPVGHDIDIPLPTTVIIPGLLPPPEGPATGYDPKKWRLSCSIPFEFTLKLFGVVKKRKSEMRNNDRRTYPKR